MRVVTADPKGILHLGCCYLLQVGSVQSGGSSAKKAVSCCRDVFTSQFLPFITEALLSKEVWTLLINNSL